MRCAVRTADSAIASAALQLQPEQDGVRLVPLIDRAPHECRPDSGKLGADRCADRPCGGTHVWLQVFEPILEWL
jgi:hypothetical protein